MKICHISSVHPRYDTRIYQKQLKTLRSTYNKVSLVVADGKGDELTADGINIYDVGKIKGRLKRFLSSGKMVLKKALELNADVYQFHDPELLRIASKLKKHGKLVVFDSHEDVPRQILSKPYLKSFVKPMLSRIYERFESRKAKHLAGIITATDFITERFSKIHPNVITVKNFPIINELQMKIDWSKKENSACYIGAIAPTRGIREIVQAVELGNLQFELAGKFSSDDLKNEVLDSPSADKIHFYGFADRQLVKTILGKSKVGLVTLHPTLSYQDALPVKMFEYMIAGVPVVTSNIPLWEKIVNDADCGIAVDPFSPQDIADAVNKIMNDDDLAERFAHNGQRAVIEHYNWENEAAKLLSFYQNLIK